MGYNIIILVTIACINGVVRTAEKNPVHILDQDSRQVCATIGKSTLAKSFYLAGGTGLALQIKHRRSFDLDFFQQGAKDKIPFVKIDGELTRLFGAAAKIELKQADQATWRIKGVKVTFLAYPFALTSSLIKGESLCPYLKGITLAAPREIALMKAYALGRRATVRDYIDIYFLLKQGIVSLQDIVAGASKKFVIGHEKMFSARLFLEQLVYWRDLDDVDVAVSLVLEPFSVQEMESYLQSQVNQFLRGCFI